MFDTLARIEEIRTAKGWSVYRMAKETGIPQSTIATWYQKSLCPPIDKLERICDAFGITLAEFFTTEASEKASKKHHELYKKLMILSDDKKKLITDMLNYL